MLVLEKLAEWLAEYLLGKAYDAITAWLERRRKDRAIDDKAKAQEQPLKDAKTPEEVDDATQNALDGF